LVMRGVPILMVSKLLGHSTISMSMRYIVLPKLISDSKT